MAHMTVKEFATARGRTTQGVYQLIRRHQKEMKRHIRTKDGVMVIGSCASRRKKRICRRRSSGYIRGSRSCWRSQRSRLCSWRPRRKRQPIRSPERQKQIRRRAARRKKSPGRPESIRSKTGKIRRSSGAKNARIRKRARAEKSKNRKRNRSRKSEKDSLPGSSVFEKLPGRGPGKF